MSNTRAKTRFALCVENKDCDDLEKGKIYRVLPDVRAKRDDFLRCLAEKLLTYALGRGLEHYDKCAIEQITKGVEQGDYRFAALVSEIVKSTPFQMRMAPDTKDQRAGR